MVNLIITSIKNQKIKHKFCQGNHFLSWPTIPVLVEDASTEVSYLKTFSAWELSQNIYKTVVFLGAYLSSLAVSSIDKLRNY